MYFQSSVLVNVLVLSLLVIVKYTIFTIATFLVTRVRVWNIFFFDFIVPGEGW